MLLARRAEAAQLPRVSLDEFVQGAWKWVEPRPLIWERHMEAVCSHLEAVFYSQRPECAPAGWDSSLDIQKLVVCMPPSTSKSLLVCVLWPAWIWSIDPSFKFFFASYDGGLTRRDSLRMMQLIESDWFTEQWGKLRGNTWTGTSMVNRHGGTRTASSLGGKATGFHADVQVVDDPLKPALVARAGLSTQRYLEKASTWWDGTMSSRNADPMKGARVIVMQRLHEEDLAGRAIRSGDYQVLNLPMRFEKDHAYKTKVGEDWRTEEGELLAPKRFPLAAVEKLEKDLGSASEVAAQLQQRPVPKGGGLFKSTWFQKRYSALPSRTSMVVQSWDLRFKDDPSSGSWVVGQTWARVGTAEYYLLHQMRRRAGLLETVQMIKDMRRMFPRTMHTLIENKANGPAVVALLRSEIPGIILSDPQGDKGARATVSAASFEAGNVWLPEKADWLDEYTNEHCSFPRGAADDQVDATSQAIAFLQGSASARYLASLERLRDEQRQSVSQG